MRAAADCASTSPSARRTPGLVGRAVETTPRPPTRRRRRLAAQGGFVALLDRGEEGVQVDGWSTDARPRTLPPWGRRRWSNHLLSTARPPTAWVRDPPIVDARRSSALTPHRRHLRPARPRVHPPRGRSPPATCWRWCPSSAGFVPRLGRHAHLGAAHPSRAATAVPEPSCSSSRPGTTGSDGCLRDLHRLELAGAPLAARRLSDRRAGTRSPLGCVPTASVVAREPGCRPRVPYDLSATAAQCPGRPRRAGPRVARGAGGLTADHAVGGRPGVGRAVRPPASPRTWTGPPAWSPGAAARGVATDHWSPTCARAASKSRFATRLVGPGSGHRLSTCRVLGRRRRRCPDPLLAAPASLRRRGRRGRLAWCALDRCADGRRRCWRGWSDGARRGPPARPGSPRGEQADEPARGSDPRRRA